MYGTILCFLIAVTIQAFAPRGEPGPWTLTDGVGLALLFGAVWGALRWRFRTLMGFVLHSESRAHRYRSTFSATLQAYQGLLLVPYAFLIYGTRYPDLVIHPLGRASEMAASLAGLAPFLFLWLLLWWEAYPLHSLIFGRSLERKRFVAAHARMEIPIIAPWLVAALVSDLFRWSWPEGFAAFEASPLLGLAYAPLFLLFAGLFLPVLVTKLWGCTPLPPGPERERIEALLARTGVRVRAVLLWPLLEGQVLTAGVVGLTRRFRYLLITPALLRALPPEDLEGVVAHEAGHVRYGHLWFYLIFFAGLLAALMALVMQGLELGLIFAAGASPGWFAGENAGVYVSGFVTLLVCALLFIAFRGVFGMVSRTFERQADGFALETLGASGPLASALERIAFHAGDIRDRPSWHHGSIAERVRTLREEAECPELLAAHHAQARRLKRKFAVALAVLATGAVLLHTPEVDAHVRWGAAEQGLTLRLALSPGDAESYVTRGAVRLERGREAEAAADLEQALALAPEHPEALNNLAWLLATSGDRRVADPVRAVTLAERAVRALPAPHVLDTLAEARYRTGDVPGALEAIEAALAAGPPDRGYYEAQRRRFWEARR